MAIIKKIATGAEMLSDIHAFCRVTGWCNRDNEPTWQGLSAEQKAEKRQGVCVCAGFSNLTPQQLNELSPFCYRENRTGKEVKLLMLDVIILEESAGNGYQLSADFHDAIADSFLHCLEEIGVEGIKYFGVPAEQRNIQFEMQPDFWEVQEDQSDIPDLGVIVARRGQEILAVFRAAIGGVGC